MTYLVDAGKMDLGHLIRCMSERPAQILKLATGRLEAGLEADFVLLDPTRAWTVGPDTLWSRSRNSSFLGETLKGLVVATFLRGRLTHHAQTPSL